MSTTKSRKPISKGTRFKIFKRDNFTCQYCSAKPPKVPLEVDHILPVSKGGGNNEENLITACFDCNRGKGSKTIEHVTGSTHERIEQLKIAQEQYKQFLKVMKTKKKLIDNDLTEVEKIYSDCFDGWEFTPKFKVSVKKFLNELGVESVCDAMERACSKIRNEDKALKYFCGICWNKIKEGK